jgi:hypothetical protein
VSRTRGNAEALLRRAWTQKATQYNAERWAPALQRTAEVALRCVRGTRAQLGSGGGLAVCSTGGGEGVCSAAGAGRSSGSTTLPPL